SEPQAILAMPWVRTVPNDGMLAEFLSDEFHSRDETLWCGVLRLVAAHQVDIAAGGARTVRYWEPDLAAELPYRRDEEYVEHYREILFDRVRRASRSFAPVTCQVSGGLDSSAVFSIAEHLRREGRLLAPGLQGRTFVFPGDRLADEVRYCRAVGRHL